MQEETEAPGAGGAVDMEEGPRAHAAVRWSGARRRQRAGGELGGREASDRFEARAVTKTNEVLIDRGVADRGFAAAECGRCQDALACDPACTTVAWHCCHVRERLQVSSLLANRGSAWGR